MGLVYAAYDPELDRKIALKLLLPALEGSNDVSTEGRTRLLREAQALARLQHPNVIAIHDVGIHEERIWLAMEYVEGWTLSDWIEQRPHKWTEVLAVLLSIGRGLVAAHRAGLLHRDIKPDNIMIAADGRVRVMDFGLARADSEVWDLKSSRDVATQRNDALSSAVTQMGALLGTPAYMAPEQFESGVVDASTDQWSFCVTAWEVLFGERPFRGETLPALVVSICEGALPEPNPAKKVPRWLQRVLARGLLVQPEARWPSMEALLDALERGRGRAWRRRMLTGATVVLALGAGVAGSYGIARQRAIAGCEAAGANIAEVWNDESRERVRAAIVNTGVADSVVTAQKVRPWLDDYARAWQEGRTEACLDAKVRSTSDEDLYARAQWCFDERRMALEALVTELSHDAHRSVAQAVSAAVSLPRIETCQDPALLLRRPTPPVGHHEDVRDVLAILAKASALQWVGAYEEGLETAHVGLERAEALAWPPLLARARLCVGELLGFRGAYTKAEEMLEEAFFEAMRAGATETATRAADRLAFVVGYQLQRHTEGLRWSRLAEFTLGALADAAGFYMATHLDRRAVVHYAAGAYDDARQLHETALLIREQLLGPTHLDVATSLNNLAIIHEATGAYEEAKLLHERALAIKEVTLGANHVAVAASFNNLALVYQSTGSYTRAKSLHESALAIRERVLGPDHPEVATSLNNLAAAHRESGAYEQARQLHERALAIWERTLGPDHSLVAVGFANLGLVHHATGAYEEAKLVYARALAIQEETLGVDHPDVAVTLGDLAAVHFATGAIEESRQLYERALLTLEPILAPDNPDLARLLVALGRIAILQGRAADAVELATRALDIPPADAFAIEQADARFVLAQAIWKVGDDPGRSIALAEQVLDTYRNAGVEGAAPLADVEAWLNDHRR
jgi:eukaryotic-like serine/threonine-protein kinase